jgi:hypothetical protein
MTMPEMPDPAPDRPSPPAGPPKWLIYGFIGKLLLVTLLTVGILWWKGFIF